MLCIVTSIAIGRAGKNHLAGPSATTPIDVLHYRIDLGLDMTTGLLEGRVTMTALMTAAADAIPVNAVFLEIDHAAVDGEPWSITADSSEESVVLHAPGAGRTVGDTVVIAVDYRRLPGFPRPGGRWGYYFFTDSIGVPANLGYTMSEPSDARFWMPCVDVPTDKATAELHVTVPPGYVVAGNGRLTGVTTATGDRVTWHWTESHPIATYLLAVTVSKFTVSTLPFVRAAQDTVPLQYYVWPPDSAACAAYLPTVRSMMAALSGLFGPYPFDKYGMTGVVPFGYGGMEHQTITTLNRYVETDEKVVVHELAHQWWGDLVTCGTWKDVWLNESFATYAEALWQETRGGRPALRRYMHDELEHFFFGSWQGGPYDPEGQGFNLFDDVVYSKGAWVLHTLRGVIGDSLFFRSLARYRAAYAGGSAVTDNFRSVVDSVTGRSMESFFDQWVYGKGWPMYASTFVWAADTLTMRVTQEQAPDWPTFTVPLQVRATSASRDTLFTITPGGRISVVRVPLTFAPSSVVLDPDSLVLKQIVAPTGIAVGPARPEEFALAQNYPNPFNGTTRISYRLPEDATVDLAVFNVLGSCVARLASGLERAGGHAVRFDASHLASGVYYLRLRAGEQSAVKRMLLIR
jgi:aminopeptidase N